MAKLNNTVEINGKTYFTGAIPTPRNLLIKAKPFIAPEAAVTQENHLYRPEKLSMWLNDVYGDCVLAEEAFARGCGDGAVFITDDSVIKCMKDYEVADGDSPYTSIVCFGKMLDESDTRGFIQGKYYHGGAGVSGVDWTNENELKQAILVGPVKLGVAASQLKGFNADKGWITANVEKDPNAIEDHCISLCGFGTISWLAEQLKIDLAGRYPHIDGSQPGWAIFSWSSIGIADTQSLLAMTYEAWVRDPINKSEDLYPSKDYPEWSINGSYQQGDRVWWLNRIWESIDDGFNVMPTANNSASYWKVVSHTNPGL